MKHAGIWFGLVLAIAPCAVQAEIVDQIVATVGPEVILQSDLMQEIGPGLSELRRTTTSPEEFNREVDKQMQQALKQAIENKILLREALLAGLTITDKQVEGRIEDIKKRFPSNEEFLKQLEAAGETMSDFRTRVRKQILAISMGLQKRQQFEKEAEVTETDVAQYYQENSGEFAHAERVRARRIFMAAGADPQERAKVKARMEELKAQLGAGADFAELAKTCSTGPDAESGGLVGWVSHSDLVPDLENALFALPEGGVSDVLDTEYGFVILMAEKREAAGTASLDDARADIVSKLRAKSADEKYRKWIGELQKRSRVRVFL